MSMTAYMALLAANQPWNLILFMVIIICQNNFRHSFSLTWSGKTCDIRRSL